MRTLTLTLTPILTLTLTLSLTLTLTQRAGGHSTSMIASMRSIVW